MGEAALFVEPIITLFGEFLYAMLGKEGRCDSAGGCFISDCLSSIFTELESCAMFRIGPSAARAIETALLIDVSNPYYVGHVLEMM
jgi:hypothetical protein